MPTQNCITIFNSDEKISVYKIFNQVFSFCLCARQLVASGTTSQNAKWVRQRERERIIFQSFSVRPDIIRHHSDLNHNPLINKYELTVYRRVLFCRNLELISHDKDFSTKQGNQEKKNENFQTSNII